MIYACFYHSVNEKSVVGVARVIKEHYQDPTTDDNRYMAVDIVPEFSFKKPVTLGQVKDDDRLSEMALIKNTRLSVQPVAKDEFDVIVNMGQEKD